MTEERGDWLSYPFSQEWHAKRAAFWREEVIVRETRVQQALEELAAAKRAVGEHEYAQAQAVDEEETP